ncbi:HAAS signaling domain-containing protein [Jiangella anatolica]|nr:hypothetical protein [Jiangella anatolica]
MEEPMLTATQHQRIDRYLAELSGALTELPAGDRDDLLAGIREHIAAALAGRTEVTDADVDEVLSALGDPLAIAAEATGGVPGGGPGGGPAPTRAAPAAPAAPTLSRDWVPAVVVLTLLLGPIVLPFLVSFGGLLLLPLLLLAGWVVLWVSPLWTPGEKLAGTFLLPAAGTAAFIAFFVAWDTSGTGSKYCEGGSTASGGYTETCTSGGGSDSGGSAIALGVLVVIAIASLVTAFVLYRNGRRRTDALAQSFSTGA